eukprot:m51a1_g8132 putative regulator of chromosome rcc1 (748) ;mRNA; r:216084-220384
MSTPSPSASPGPNKSNKCAACGKSAYEQERMVVDGVVYHKTCLKCEICKKTLGTGNYTALSGHYYCKPCYIRLFKTKGNYDEGFGREQHKKNWAPAVFGAKDFTKCDGASSSDGSPSLDADDSPEPARSPSPRCHSLHATSSVPDASPPIAVPQPTKAPGPGSSSEGSSPCAKSPVAESQRRNREAAPSPLGTPVEIAARSSLPPAGRKLPDPSARKHSADVISPARPKEDEEESREGRPLPDPAKKDASPEKITAAKKSKSFSGDKGAPCAADAARAKASAPHTSAAPAAADVAPATASDDHKGDRPEGEAAAHEEHAAEAGAPEASSAAAAAAPAPEKAEGPAAEGPRGHRAIVYLDDEGHMIGSPKVARKQTTDVAVQEPKPFSKCGEFVGCGVNLAGQLGLGDTTEHPTPLLNEALAGRPLLRVCSWDHTLAVTATGDLLAWGPNSKSQLGLGDCEHRLTPTAVPTGDAWGACGLADVACGAAHSLAPRARPARVAVFEDVRVARVFAGELHSFAVLSTGELYAWGSNSAGQLGLGDTVSRANPEQVPLFPPPGRHIVEMACGSLHTLALLDNGQVWSWGSSRYGELGHGDTAQHSAPQQLSFFDTRPVRSVRCGAHHSAALTASGELYVWGLNAAGQLGLGAPRDHNAPQRNEQAEQLAGSITAVDCGGSHMAVVGERHEVYVWGDNSAGQLGLASHKNMYQPQRLKVRSANAPDTLCCGFRHTLVGLVPVPAAAAAAPAQQ